MAGKFWLWNLTAGSNANADPSINWAEGQAPSSVNDSARAMMAAIASYRNDVSGSQVVSGGSSTVYSLTTSQGFASAADMDGQEFTFVITPTNGAGATLNVNSIGAFPLVFSIGSPMPAGTMVDGSIYTATFVNSASCFKVRSFFGSTFNVPLAGMMDYIAPTVPNANFVFPVGQAISRTTYAALFGLVGTTYGVGDGTTTFNVPDLTGRITAMKEATATRLTTAGSGVDGGTLGSSGGAQNVLLAAVQIPSIASTASPSLSVATTTTGFVAGNTADSTPINVGNGGSNSGYTISVGGAPTVAHQAATGTATGTVSSTYTNSSQTVTRTVPPLIVLNKILRII